MNNPFVDVQTNKRNLIKLCKEQRKVCNGTGISSWFSQSLGQPGSSS